MSKFAIKCRKGKLVYPAVMAVGMLVVGGNKINYDLAKRWKNGPTVSIDLLPEGLFSTLEVTISLANCRVYLLVVNVTTVRS